MTAPIAYLNGRFVPIDEAQIHVFDLGIVGGTSVTEMLRTFRHSPFRLDDHLDRLAESLQRVGIDPGLAWSELREISEQVVSTNAKLIPAHHDLGLILFVTAGLNTTYVGRGLAGRPTVCIHTFPLPFELWAENYDVGLHLVTVSTRSIPDNVIDPRIKHRSRLHWHLAGREARQIDSHAMAILTDEAGNLTETATGNLCIVAGNRILTPAAHVLEGVSRNYVAELASKLGYEFIYTTVTPADLSSATEAFLTSTPHCLLPVTHFNQRPVGTGRPGSAFQKLIAVWSDSVGVNVIEQMKTGSAERTAKS